ncbi:protein mono-ADP-ribosyltransferase PARP14-like [Polypterus senegalus]|uniref:protein mono-ADP-ribosyltransferase PARP14-like n=1 Tax=Polypterus senegalus TaxID=55291 RepID=UPI0019653666|nr:protein mono-ADP-ribosyltransferase PARP14-like [Polypterus senegalus]
MESYPYPICVELRNLEEKHKERIVSYFRIKRKSGGGECSELKLLQGNVYTISFKEEQAQQRVLDAKDHIINVANETIKVTVWKSEEVKPPQEMFANEDNFGKFKGSDTCSPSVSSTNREHTMVQKVDPYLRQYLQDCKDVAYELSQQLSQIQCSPQFLAESDNTILIKMSSGENSCSENVESIFKSMAKKYECHVEVDPRKRQILMKMPHLIKKPLQVYNEPTQRTTVIVGPIADIYELLTVVEGVASQDRQGESMKIQLRMSKPKYTLLLDSFERAMEGQIKISFDGKSAMYLEGTPDAVKKGACKFQEQSKKILEETIDVKSFLKTFLRLKSTQDTLATLLSSQGIAVTMDIDLDVTFFGLSMEMLENAKKILLTKLLQEEENLPESFKTTSKLEKLKKFVQETEDQINKVTTKVKIQEVAQWQRICVAGFTENVRYVIKTLKDYFDNNALTTLEVPLQFPQVASCFHDLLNYKDLQFSGVELQIVETIPLKVNITGPQQLASNVQRSIEKALRSVIVEVLVISKPGAYKYFSECGRTYISLFSKNCKCVIELKESTSIKELNSSETQRDLCGFELETGLVLSLRQGDITKQKVDVIVNAANELLSHGKGVASAISKAGGSEFQRECSELVKRQGQIKTGTAVLTNAWKLPCKAVIHAVGPNWNEEKDVNRVKQLLGSAIKDALEIAEKGGFQTMAIPCVSCGRYNVPIEIGAECVISTVRNFAIIPRKVRSITIVDINRDTLGKFQGACHKLLGKGGAASNQNFKDEKASDVQMSTDDVTNSNLQVEVVLGSLENQKADALVVPLPHTLDINTTKVSKNLIERAGKQLINRFDDSTKNKKISPGDVVPVQEVPNLECIQVLYLVCLKWDGAQGKALEILKKTFQDCLEHCHLNALQSAAIPVIGPGKILGFPHDVAIKALLEEISRFEKVCPSWLKKVRIVIHPDDKVSSKVSLISNADIIK